MANGEKITNSEKTILLARIMSLEDAVKRLFVILEKHLGNQHDDVKALRKRLNGR